MTHSGSPPDRPGPRRASAVDPLRRARRRLAGAVLGGTALAALPAIARAQSAVAWPTRPVTLVVPYSPGGLTDQVTRPLAEVLARQTGQPVTVANRTGAGGLIGLRSVLAAPRDGYTLALVVPATMVTLPLTNRDYTIDPLRDFAPLTIAVDTFMVLVAHPSVARSLPELVSYARANPTRTNYGTPGAGSSFHFYSARLAQLLGFEAQHVAYKGEIDALNDCAGGRIQFMLASSAARSFIDAGRLVPLGVTARERVGPLPDVPTLREQRVDLVSDGWVGYAAAAGTPEPLLARIAAAFTAALADPDLRARYTAMGYATRGSSREEFVADVRRASGQFKELLDSGAVKIEGS